MTMKQKRITLLSSLIAMLLLAPFALADELKVGWASVDITPEISEQRQAVLGGLLIPRYASTVKSPLTATALALESTSPKGVNEQAVLISCDLTTTVFFYNEHPSLLLQVRERLHNRLPDLNPGKVFLMATHAHSTPTFDENLFPVKKEGIVPPAEYLELLVTRLTAVIERAWLARKPGGVSWGLDHAVVGYNRRVVYPDGRAVMGGWRRNPKFDRVEGMEDHGVELLCFWSPARKLTGILINVACPSQVDSQALFVSADFWDSVRNNLRKNPDFADVAILPQLAAAGDQWPTYSYVREKAEAIMRERRGLSKTEELGRRIANAVLDAYPYSKQDIAYDLPFIHRVEPVKIPYRQLTASEASDVQKELSRLEITTSDPFRYSQMQKCRTILERYSRQKDGPIAAEIEIHVLRLGDVAMATNPFELYVDYGMQIKAQSPATLTLTSQLSAEVGPYEGYLATSRAIAAGGYSAEILWMNYVGPEGGRVLVDRTVEIINELWK